MRNHSWHHSNSSSVFAQTGLAAALHEEDEDDFDADELCVVCWVGQRSVALVHGNDAHLVREGEGAAAALQLHMYVTFTACCVICT
jgi:aspartate oxidase